ncbi:MAG: potassium-transporting ATPase subunit KdpA, partial [Gammaproteobacteria bacterium]|nr:potassium-transporting ATPase subunit KdpA [Gammaproteobacteria bacterium]
LSAAAGLSVLMALIRGLGRSETKNLGNFWQDTVRGVLYILLPLSLLISGLLVAQGVPQNIKAYQTTHTLQSTSNQPTQVIPMGPVASQVAIKQLGTNGGGFFNTNSAHPFENPTPFSNFIELLAILLIPAALCYTYGSMINDKRQGWAVLIAMLLIFVPVTFSVVAAEQAGNPTLTQLGVLNAPQPGLYSGGNMEGKETRFGITDSGLWASATTATSNGSVNSMHDSYMPISGFLILVLMHFGEVIFGGVGSGLYGMLMLIIITVFVAGLMVGRTPEFLGKKIEPYEMKMAVIAVLVMPLTVLLFTAIAVLMAAGTAAMGNPGAQGFTEVLYAFTSMANNNGSAFGGLNASTPFYTLSGTLVMFLGRYGIAIPVLALAGSLVKKKKIPIGAGTLRTHTPLFVVLLIGTTIILGVLSFLPALALGPIVEQLTLWG